MKYRLRRDPEKRSAEHIVKCSDYGDWFLIYKLAQNMDPTTYGDLIIDIDQKFRKWDNLNLPDEEMVLAASAPKPSRESSPAHAGRFTA